MSMRITDANTVARATVLTLALLAASAGCNDGSTDGDGGESVVTDAGSHVGDSGMDGAGAMDAVGSDDTSGVDSAGPEPDAMELPGPFPNQPAGNPLVPESALCPFPSDFYLADDPTTPTGRRLALPQEAFRPGQRQGQALFDSVDGFSVTPLIVAYLPGSVDVATLPSPTEHGESIADESTVFLVEEGTWERIPVLAEIDANAIVTEQTALLIRALTALKPNTGYAVVLREGLRAMDGTAHVANEAFMALRDGTPTADPAIEAQRDDFELVAMAIAELGLEPDEVILAWSFHTRSEERLVGPLLAAQSSANTAPMGDYTLTKDAVEGANRQIRGTFSGPNYTDPETGALDWNPDTGELTQFGKREVPFVMTIPDVVDEPRPLIIFGHGFLGTSNQATGGRFNRFCTENRFSTAATEFGIYEALIDPLVVALSGDLPKTDVVVGEVIQAFANTTYLTRLVKERLAVDLTLAGSGGSPIDTEAVHYLGISNGGTFGYVHAATSPQVERAVMLVGGGGLVHFLERAVNWQDFAFVFDALYPNSLDLQVFFSIVQQKLDAIDSMSFARRLVHDRYPGLGPLKAQVHMAVNDSQVRNLVTEWVVRSAGIPMVVPSAKDIYSVAPLTIDGVAPPDVMSAFYVYDEMVEPTPITNDTPLSDNGTHGTVRDLMSYRTQAGTFLENGTFIMACDGPCDPE
ncbi:MAG: pimeloyl-ACP methyl ester carboxylesterase [Myxococcota bacterium]|jgi:pimeloyl-ACP methyl ester carboxylesterase